MKLVRGSIALAASLGYLIYVFRFFDGRSWAWGLGDWQDPYFINALMEHWYRSATSLTDPSSPPMFFPARRTLGYSHGLVLYAPFYIPLRVFLHPFHAHTLMLAAVIETGILCLYALLRRFRLSFFESLVLTAFFLSANVVHGETAVWSQRASAFLVPPLLLVFAVCIGMRPGTARLAIGGFVGLVSALMYVQDFYTAQFTALFAASFGAAIAFVDFAAFKRAKSVWRSLGWSARLSLVIAAVAGAWALIVSTFGGGEVLVSGVRLRTHDWRRPAALAFGAGVSALMLAGGPSRFREWIAGFRSWLGAVLLGALIGVALFAWIYMGAYREHSAFPTEHLLNALTIVDPSRWDTWLAFARDVLGYRSHRSVVLVFAVCAVAWIPWFRTGVRVQRYALWLLVVSVIVLLIPLRVSEWSTWRLLFQWWPGFGVIRDPKRIIVIYELAIVVAIALLMARSPEASRTRHAVTLTALALMVIAPNGERFDYERPIETYERWVAAPIQIAPSCGSFYIGRASTAYTSRARGTAPLYAVDSLFVSLRHGIPTLNGYSAWSPESWNLANPHDADYRDRVERWIHSNGLTGVCEFDIEQRTMGPRR